MTGPSARGAHQEALTVVAVIKDGHADSVKALLGTIADPGPIWDRVPFGSLSGVHFARLVVFDEAADLNGLRLPAQLALMTNIDAPIDGHLEGLATDGAHGLDDLFGHCENYPEEPQRTPVARQAFLRRHQVRARAFYVNRQGRTVAQIRGEEDLRKAIADFLDSEDRSRQTLEDIRSAIVDFVRRRADLAWSLEPAAPPSLRWRAWEWCHRIGLPLVALLLAPVLLIALLPLVVLLRVHEKRDVPDASQAGAGEVARFREDEDIWAHNQVTVVGLFKRGWFRWITATAILAVTDYACRHIYNRGFLAGLNTIHFARWVPLDGGRRLFFSSNYDGSLESYMNDFIDKAAWGLNAIFSNGDGFPRTAFLFCGGITDEKAYKRFLPTRQVRTRLWYSAYPHLTTKNIANNAEIRKGLSARLTTAETRDWLNRFGSGNQLQASGLIARLLDSVPWNTLCRRCCR